MRRLLIGVLVVASLLAASMSSAAVVPTWPSASEVWLPNNANTAPGGQTAGLYAISCFALGDCEGAGQYMDAAGESQAMVVNESGGIWGQASELALPAGADTSFTNYGAALNSVACTSVGNCEAVGVYPDSYDTQEAMMVREVDGVWQKAIETRLPPGAVPPGQPLPNGQTQIAALTSVSCTRPGYCVAVGTYIDGGTGELQGMAVSEAHGVWGQATEMTGPNQTSGALASVTCASPGNCEAVGSYIDAHSNILTLVVNEKDGVWGQPTGTSLPTNQMMNGWQGAYLSSVACSSVGNCTAAGNYVDTSTYYQGMVVSETNGVWGPATEISLPPNQTTGWQGATLMAISCPNQRSCEVGGYYIDASGAYQSMVAPESNGVWGAAVQLPEPSGAPSAGIANANLNDLSCPKEGGCEEAGYYLDSTGSIQAMTATSVPTS